MDMTSASSGTFVYANPRTIHWGAGTLAERLDTELSQRGLTRAFVITTRSVAAHASLGGKLRQLLGDRYEGEFSAIGQHAPAANVAAAVDAARQAQPDVLISFGGGSPIDAAKSAAFATATGLDLRDERAADTARGMRPEIGRAH